MRHPAPLAALAALTCLLAPLAEGALRRDPVRAPNPGQAVGRPPDRGPIRPDIPVIPPLGSMPAPRCTVATTTGEIMSAELDAPLPGTVLTGYGDTCPLTIDVTGTGSVGATLSDLYFVIDSSGSTAACSGFDVDEDGDIGLPDPFFGGCTDIDDTILAAEVRAVRDFVATLNPATSRVAIIQFSAPEGSLGVGERQQIIQSLTSDFLAVNSALDIIMFFGSAGATDYGGALQLVRSEALANGLPATRRQRSYFLSDGIPTFPMFPFNLEDPPDAQTAIDEADLLAAVPLRVDTFGVGFIPTVTQDPVFPRRCIDGLTETSTLECIALRTNGTFFASTDPEEIVERLLLSRPAGIESVTILNQTNGFVQVVVPSPDGAFGAPLPLEEGVVNDILVTIRAEDGTECSLETNVMALCFSAGCSPLTQGYWHRQCSGFGLIGLDGTGPPPHPDWTPETLLRVMAGVTDPLIRLLSSPADQTTCEALDADPQDDPCQRAIKQYAAVLLNIHAGHLAPDCLLRLPDVGVVTPQEAQVLLHDLIVLGLAGDEEACKRANDLADLINTGAALR
jgi:hypothetical protein